MGNRQTAIMEQEARSRIAYAMDHLLHRLKKFVQVVPMSADDHMPEHDLVWVTEMDDDPRKVISEAMKAHPELWLHALPKEVCIVPRKELKSVAGLDSEVIECLNALGGSVIANSAARNLLET